MSEDAPDLERRFGGVRRLWGGAALGRFRAARAAVVGLGGVGSWAAEALARSAVGAIALIDLDMIAESNVNRQIHAFDGAFGRGKADALAERVRAINPACRVEAVEDFVTPENVSDLIGGEFDAVVDAIDQVRAKAAIVAHCARRGLFVVTAGGAGGKLDPARARVADLARAEQDPLLAKLRARLRREYGFPRGAARRFGVPAVFSDEPARRPENACAAAGLACAGYGSSVCVTAVFGFLAANLALESIAGRGAGE
ncbi:MAG: tRNA threonylcarbamoyladenosine dehydratase [Candidatus Accumulibacter sp.]|jgi:tRNA A37 threonylcarbamoyladenosine dehydratase|nr:tRNA threonylcarbamoyladenosine dehydratase [Accumulibacter sp.]